MTDKIRALEAPVNPNVPELNPGDTVSVHVKIKEGDKERIQEFRGTVIRIRKGGAQSNFTVRRVAVHGIGVERTFPLRSPSLGPGGGPEGRAGPPGAVVFPAQPARKARAPARQDRRRVSSAGFSNTTRLPSRVLIPRRTCRKG